MLRLLPFCLILFISSHTLSQIREFKKEDWLPKLDSMRAEWGVNKTDMSETYELPILIALSYYPELKSTHIRFLETKIKTSMNAQPTLGSILFRKKEKWRFVVRINNQIKDSMVLVSKVPFNALVGVFGHEFWHFMDYRQKEGGHFIGFLFSYLTKKGREKVEKRTDRGTIDRGLGWQCYDFEDYVQNQSNATERYKEFKKLIYLEKEEILEYMNTLPLYE